MPEQPGRLRSLQPRPNYFSVIFLVFLLNKQSKIHKLMALHLRGGPALTAWFLFKERSPPLPGREAAFYPKKDPLWGFCAFGRHWGNGIGRMPLNAKTNGFSPCVSLNISSYGRKVNFAQVNCGHYPYTLFKGVLGWILSEYH